MPEQAVVVEIRASTVGTGACQQRAPARVEIRLGRGGFRPVFETVGRYRRLGVVGNEEQPGNTTVPEVGETLGVSGPTHQLYVHSGNVRVLCFARITAR